MLSKDDIVDEQEVPALRELRRVDCPTRKCHASDAYARLADRISRMSGLDASRSD
jgi:hypothetical protein